MCWDVHKEGGHSLKKTLSRDLNVRSEPGELGGEQRGKGKFSRSLGLVCWSARVVSVVKLCHHALLSAVRQRMGKHQVFALNEFS